VDSRPLVPIAAIGRHPVTAPRHLRLRLAHQDVGRGGAGNE
jgi:hypothetical protein